MLSYQSLKKTQLTARSRHRREHALILDALRKLDPQAQALDYPDALTSKALVRALWDALPGEHEALKFASPEEQTAADAGARIASSTGLVTLHLGWDLLAFSTSFHAAWNAWPHFCSVNTDAYNACIYPEDLKWYVVRAGGNLYSMDCTHGQLPELATK